MQTHESGQFRQMSEIGLYLHKSFWAYPFLSVMFNIVFGYVLCSIDIAAERYHGFQTGDKSAYVVIFTGSVDGARALASMLSSTAISVVTLTFSLTVLSLQIAASNYSPRILDEFIKDRVRSLLATTPGVPDASEACLFDAEVSLLSGLLGLTLLLAWIDNQVDAERLPWNLRLLLCHPMGPAY